MLETKRKRLLEGSVAKSLLVLSIPIIFANILQSLYQLIDTFWVGRIGTNAVAAVSLSFPILFFMTSFAMGFTMAGSILIAQYNGKNDSKNVSFMTAQTFLLVCGIALIMTVIGYFTAGPILSLLTNDVAVLGPATAYLQISFLGLVTMFIYTIFQSALRGVGEVKIPMVIIFIAVILNLILDPLFMFGWWIIPGTGVVGVAWATFFTQLLSAIFGIIILLRGKHGITLHLSDFTFHFATIKRLCKLGFPSSLEMSSRSLGMVLMTIVVAAFGTTIVAAFGIGSRILSFIIIPALGLSIGTSTLAGNNLGANLIERTKQIAKTALRLGFFSLTLVGALLFIFAPQIVAFFVPGETQVIEIATTYLRIMAMSFGFISIQMVVIGLLKAAGRTVISMSIAMFQALVVVVASLVFAYLFNLSEIGIWIAYPVTNVCAAIVAFYFYFKKDWLKRDLVE